jgi:hypothetical protein
MNLDELVESIENSDVGLRKQLEIIVSNWKTDNSSIEDLIYLIGKWHGNVWFSGDESSNLFYENWCEFKNIAVSSIKGMTFNERLYWFGLFEIWDKSNDAFKKTIRLKLKAE